MPALLHRLEACATNCDEKVGCIKCQITICYDRVTAFGLGTMAREATAGLWVKTHGLRVKTAFNH